MHSAERAGLAIPGGVALNHGWIQPVRFELASTKGARKEAALVSVRLEIDKIGAGKRGFGEDHCGEAAPFLQKKS